MKKLIGVLIIILVAGGVFVGCGNKTQAVPKQTPSESTQKPTTIDGIIKSNFKDAKVNIDTKTNIITVTYPIEDNFSNNLIVTNNLMKIKSCLKDLKGNSEFSKFDYITFDATGEFTNQYGEKSTGTVTEHNFDISKLNKVVNYDNIDNQQLIQLQDGNTMINPSFKKGLKLDTIKLLQPNN